MSDLTKKDVYEVQSSDLYRDIATIVKHAQRHAYTAINTDLIKRNWLLGKRIAEEELEGAERAEYGKKLLSNLSKQLTSVFGKGFDMSELYRCMKVYQMMPDLYSIQSDGALKDFLGALSEKSTLNILETLSPNLNYPLLSWSHYTKLLQVDNAEN